MHAYLGLGSNRGNRIDWLRRGLDALAGAAVTIDAGSNLWLSEPVGDPGLPWFVNCVVRVVDPESPDHLLQAAMAAEHACGRVRVPGVVTARTFDADVLLYDAQVIRRPDLEVPHPRMCDRRFVLNPLAEIAPDVVHPGRLRTIHELRDELVADERAWVLGPPLI